RLPAMASTTSTSKPVYSPGDPSFSNSNGEYGMSEHTVSVPSVTRPRSAGTMVVSELAPEVPSVEGGVPVSASLSSSPHALATKPNTTSNANSIRQDVRMVTPLCRSGAGRIVGTRRTVVAVPGGACNGTPRDPRGRSGGGQAGREAAKGPSPMGCRVLLLGGHLREGAAVALVGHE